MSIERHEMQLEKIHSSGAEEWFCPDCERRYLICWQPAFKKIILQVGNEHALHNGSKGGPVIGPPQTNEEEPQLSPVWLAALDELDFSDWSS